MKASSPREKYLGIILWTAQQAKGADHVVVPLQIHPPHDRRLSGGGAPVSTFTASPSAPGTACQGKVSANFLHGGVSQVDSENGLDVNQTP